MFLIRQWEWNRYFFRFSNNFIPCPAFMFEILSSDFSPFSGFSNSALCEKCPNTVFFLVRIFCIRSEYRKIWTRKNSVFRHFSRSVSKSKIGILQLPSILVSWFLGTTIANLHLGVLIYTTLDIKFWF